MVEHCLQQLISMLPNKKEKRDVCVILCPSFREMEVRDKEIFLDLLFLICLQIKTILMPSGESGGHSPVSLNASISCQRALLSISLLCHGKFTEGLS